MDFTIARSHVRILLGGGHGTGTGEIGQVISVIVLRAVSGPHTGLAV